MLKCHLPDARKLLPSGNPAARLGQLVEFLHGGADPAVLPNTGPRPRFRPSCRRPFSSSSLLRRRRLLLSLVVPGDGDHRFGEISALEQKRALSHHIIVDRRGLGPLDHRQFAPLSPLADIRDGGSSSYGRHRARTQRRWGQNRAGRVMRRRRGKAGVAGRLLVAGDDDVNLWPAGAQDVPRLLHGDAAQARTVHVDDFVADKESAVPAKEKRAWRLRVSDLILLLANEYLNNVPKGRHSIVQ